MNTIYILALVTIFFVAGINKIFNFSKTANGLHNKLIFNQLPYVISSLAITVVIFIEILSPVLIMYATQNDTFNLYAKYSALYLLLFTVIATLYYHNPLVDPSENISFMKNLSIIGGLGITMNHFSID
mgnify:CR=1 FL=1